jgi:hypothetical protein
MLRKVSIRNFKCLQDVRIELDTLKCESFSSEGACYRESVAPLLRESSPRTPLTEPERP